MFHEQQPLLYVRARVFSHLSPRAIKLEWPLNFCHGRSAFYHERSWEREPTLEAQMVFASDSIFQL